MKSVEKSLRKFIDEWGFDQGKQLNNFKFDNEAMILFAESYSESQNKELIEEVQRLKEIDIERSKQNKRILRYLNEY